ncbi:hypothetical protein SRHO_G00005800 [Serrasalmus rhombeus]
MKKGREFSVFRSSSPSQHRPDNRNIRKQRSLGNLTLLSDGEQKIYSFDLDEPPKEEAGRKKPDGRKKPKEGGASRARSLSLSLTKMLSQSEHSLIPVPWGQKVSRPGSRGTEPTAATKRRASREDDHEEEEDPKAPGAGEWAEEIESAREERAELDKEVILTMLGDLEQVLNTHTHPIREDPETRRMRTVKNIADLRQNLEETMSSLRGTQISHSTLETTFDTTVTTEVNGRGLPSLSSRSSPMAWRLGQSQSPRLQAGDAPSMPGYAPPRSGATGATGRYGDASRFVYSAPLRRVATSGGRGAELGEKGMPSEVGPEGDVGGYMSDGDILAKNVRADDVSSGYLTDGGIHLYSRSVSRPELPSTREVVHRGVREQGDADR